MLVSYNISSCSCFVGLYNYENDSLNILYFVDGQEAPGWWTSGRFLSTSNQFVWTTSMTRISPYHSNWGSRSHPYDNTCVVFLANTAYAFTLSNQSCDKYAGLICQINLPQ